MRRRPLFVFGNNLGIRYVLQQGDGPILLLNNDTLLVQGRASAMAGRLPSNLRLGMEVES